MQFYLTVLLAASGLALPVLGEGSSLASVKSATTSLLDKFKALRLNPFRKAVPAFQETVVQKYEFHSRKASVEELMAMGYNRGQAEKLLLNIHGMVAVDGPGQPQPRVVDTSLATVRFATTSLLDKFKVSRLNTLRKVTPAVQETEQKYEFYSRKASVEELMAMGYNRGQAEKSLIIFQEWFAVGGTGQPPPRFADTQSRAPAPEVNNEVRIVGQKYETRKRQATIEEILSLGGRTRGEAEKAVITINGRVAVGGPGQAAPRLPNINYPIFTPHPLAGERSMTEAEMVGERVTAWLAAHAKLAAEDSTDKVGSFRIWLE